VIDGPTEGEVGIEYNYTFVSDDPDGDNLSYYITWGDMSAAIEWAGPYPSGDVVTFSHTYTEQGEMTISAKAKDTHDEESEWGYLDIEMPFSFEFVIRNYLLRG
jgi:hypothetical protein